MSGSVHESQTQSDGLRSDAVGAVGNREASPVNGGRRAGIPTPAGDVLRLSRRGPADGRHDPARSLRRAWSSSRGAFDPGSDEPAGGRRRDDPREPGRGRRSLRHASGKHGSSDPREGDRRPQSVATTDRPRHRSRSARPEVGVVRAHPPPGVVRSDHRARAWSHSRVSGSHAHRGGYGIHEPRNARGPASGRTTE